ncbi:hypothetical protein HMPREF2660_07990 [Weeksella sp. HMSC059D05]|nr:hypothetical protein HMPREF2660_07990 [Weeksella sp. HMSC059D05]
MIFREIKIKLNKKTHKMAKKKSPEDLRTNKFVNRASGEVNGFADNALEKPPELPFNGLYFSCLLFN